MIARDLFATMKLPRRLRSMKPGTCPNAFGRVRRGPGASRRSAFTILEILIASAILVVGLVGVLALFPVGISSGRKVVEDSTAIAISRSVADSIRSGMRNNLRYRTSRGGGVFTYFVFWHDGVKDRVPRDQAKESPGHDYYILLPRFKENRKFGKGLKGREDANAVAPVFVYPESDPDASSDNSASGNGNPFEADNDGDDFSIKAILENGREEVFNDVFVRKVYTLGSTFPKIGDEGPDVLEDQTREVLKQYSFAFSVQPSFYDANMLDTGDGFVPGNELYSFRVMVFRSFGKNFVSGEDADPVTPVFELDFDVAR
jgi:type II secretory pathway pseudopilin PulG